MKRRREKDGEEKERYLGLLACTDVRRNVDGVEVHPGPFPVLALLDGLRGNDSAVQDAVEHDVASGRLSDDFGDVGVLKLDERTSLGVSSL